MSTYISVSLLRQVRERFSNCCAYCQTAEALMAVTFEIEHIVPVSVGGQSVFENLCLACPMCNRYKANRQIVVDTITHQNTALFHPHLQSWEEHFCWSEDKSEIVGQTATGRATIEALRMNRPALVRVRHLWVILGEHPPKRDQ